mmetsp:Transcript_18079/g.25749  ORF Transcript_18079/g.25749 Transcript_18079/m.25749 type:complete len:444 (-) Transcript_18079:27-1358(-)
MKADSIPFAGKKREEKKRLSMFAIFTCTSIGVALSILTTYENTKHILRLGERSLAVRIPSRQAFLGGGLRFQGISNEEKKTFPSPLEKVFNGKVILKPAFGTHRPQADAIFSFAQGYPLQDFIKFIRTLEQTGYSGDVVFSVQQYDKLNQDIIEFLSQKFERLNVIVYSISWQCFQRNGDPLEMPDDYALCKIQSDFYADKTNQTILQDPRIPRPLATARFDLYWAWVLQYNPLSMLMLIDFRDVIFQLHPFINITRSLPGSNEGVLYFYEEHFSTLIGQSAFNYGWLQGAYGRDEAEKMKEKRIICSGSTIGEQVAVESYLRAMILQFDQTNCIMKGCDQGMHNFLYHNGTLNNSTGIRDVFSVEHGKGNVLNLSVLRKKPLREWGLFTGELPVVNWDQTVAPVVHQYDRDTELNQKVHQLRNTLVEEWEKKKASSSRPISQ